MRDIPIIFSAPMVRALLDGRKTQTRRLVPQPPAECGINYMLGEESWLPVEERTPVRRHFEAWTGPLFQNRPAGHLCGSFDITPRFQPRDRLWVRESIVLRDLGGGFLSPLYAADEAHVMEDGHRASNHEFAKGGRKAVPSIHMPRWASRLTLIVEGVKVDRLQDISEEDAAAEGIYQHADRVHKDETWTYGGNAYFDRPSVAFWHLWTSIHGLESWAANPWVVAISFRVERANIDALMQEAA